MCAWPAGRQDGHHLVNESDRDCTFIAISAGPEGSGGYSDIDMRWGPEGFTRKDGSAF